MSRYLHPGEFRHFSRKDIGQAIQHGVPMAPLLVPVSGVRALLSGLSILFGFHARLGAWGIVVFLAAITPVMHNFWTVTDPTMRTCKWRIS
jgi:putative oxidoreductase